MSIVERLKSPVVLIQLLSIVLAAAVFFFPGQSEQIKIVVGTAVAIINVFAGLNDPTNKTGF